MIELLKVTKIIKGKEVLKKVSIKLNEGEIVLLQGKNGSGKTMLLRMIAGFIKPTEGFVIRRKELSYGVIIENPSFFMQESALYNLKYLANINKKIKEDEIIKYLKKFGLYDIRNNKVKTFSLGMKQRLALCQAFMEDPDVLLLDEPFNAIDDDNMKKVIDLLKEFRKKGKLIIIASHGDVSTCKFDKVLKMEEGKIKIVK